MRRKAGDSPRTRHLKVKRIVRSYLKQIEQMARRDSNSNRWKTLSWAVFDIANTVGKLAETVNKEKELLAAERKQATAVVDTMAKIVR